MKILKNMGLISKLLGSSTVLLIIISAVLLISIKNKKAKIDKLEQEKVAMQSQIISLKMELDSNLINYNNIIRETQSVLAQIHNKNKSLEKENSNLRKGVRLDLLTIRTRRNGKIIDSVYREAYKYLNK